MSLVDTRIANFPPKSTTNPESHIFYFYGIPNQLIWARQGGSKWPLLAALVYNWAPPWPPQFTIGNLFKAILTCENVYTAQTCSKIQSPGTNAVHEFWIICHHHRNTSKTHAKLHISGLHIVNWIWRNWSLAPISQAPYPKWSLSRTKEE